MIVHSHRKRLLGEVLTDYVLIQRAPDFRGLRHANIRRLAPGVFVEFLIEDALANVYAAVADVNARPGNQFSDLGVAFAAEGAHGEVRSAGHMLWFFGYPFRDSTASGTSTSRPAGGVLPSSNLIS